MTASEKACDVPNQFFFYVSVCFIKLVGLHIEFLFLC